MPGSDPLARVKRAAAAERRAAAELRAALLDAYAQGVPYAETARVLGVSRQAVRQLVRRSGA